MQDPVARDGFAPPGGADRRPRERSRPSAGSPTTFLPAIVVVLVVALLIVRTPSAPASGPTTPYGPLLWSGNSTAENGVLRMALSPLGAGASAGPVHGPSGAGVSVVMLGLEELGSYGAVISTTGFPAAGGSSVPGWMVYNASAPAGLSVRYFDAPGVVRPTGVVLGQHALVNATVASGASTATAGNLSVTVDVRDWPWIHATDSLVYFFDVAPTDSSVAALSNGSANTLLCGPRAGAGNVSESATWSSDALAIDSAGDRFQVPTAATVIGTPSDALLEVGIPGGSGGYTDVSLSVTIAVPVPVGPPALSSDLVALCLGWAVVVGGVASIAVWRANDRTPA